jgi:hypothetical protein
MSSFVWLAISPVCAWLAGPTETALNAKAEAAVSNKYLIQNLPYPIEISPVLSSCLDLHKSACARTDCLDRNPSAFAGCCQDCPAIGVEPP